jgi:hypothetical protein
MLDIFDSTVEFVKAYKWWFAAGVPIVLAILALRARG